MFQFRSVLILGFALSFLVFGFTAFVTPTTKKNDDSKASQQQTMTGLQVLQKMIETNRKTNTLKFTLNKWDRINGKLIETKMNVKFSRNPFKVYMKRFDRNIEVLYVQGQNNNKAWVNAGSLIPTLSLDPYGSQMRENEHHTVHSSGFDKLANTLEFLANKYKDKAATMAKLQGIIDWRGRQTYKIELENTNFKYYEYTVLANETLISIAKKFQLSEHMILEKNKATVDDYNDVKAGQKIQIPTDYAKKTLIFIDKETFLPSAAIIYDDLGEYERFYHDNIVANPVFAADEFTTKFKDYKF